MRTLSTLVKAALSGQTVTARHIVRGFLPGTTYCATDGPDDFIWDNGAGPLTYTAFGEALRITLPAFDTQNKVNQAQIMLSGVDPGVMTSLFEEDYRAAPCDICLLLFDPATGLPAEELMMFRGLLDSGAISDQPAKAADPSAVQISTLTVTVSPLTVDIKRASGRMATDPDQRLFRDANDGFFKDVALVGVSNINWGQAGTSSPATSAPNSGAATTTSPAYFIPPPDLPIF